MTFDESGTLYRDTCRKLFVKCDNGRVDEVKDLVKSIGRRLGQKAMDRIRLQRKRTDH